MRHELPLIDDRDKCELIMWGSWQSAFEERETKLNRIRDVNGSLQSMSTTVS